MLMRTFRTWDPSTWEDYQSAGCVEMVGIPWRWEEARSGLRGGSEEHRDSNVLFQKKLSITWTDLPLMLGLGAAVRCAQVTPKTRRVVASDVHMRS